MSKCPHTARLARALAEAIDGLPRVQLAVDYVMGGGKGKLTSLRGRSEVQGNIVQLCAAQEIDDASTLLAFINCMNKRLSTIPLDWRRCVPSTSSPDSIDTCSTGAAGRRLGRASRQRARAAGIRGTPTLFIAGKRYTGGRTALMLGRAICAAFRGGRPPGCSDLPAPVRVPVTVITDRRCRRCPTEIQQLEKNLRERHFPGLAVTRIDYADPKGRQLYARLGLKYLPAWLFSARVRSAPGYAHLKRWMSKAGTYLQLKAPSRFDPAAEICDNGKDDTHNGRVDCADPTCARRLLCRPRRPGQLEMFIMAKDPFANRALLKKIGPALAGFGEQLKLVIHYVVDKTARGFKAVRGPSEVSETLRQVCLRRHAPATFLRYLLCRAADYASDAWQRCLDRVKPSVIDRCAAGREGARLLARDLQVAKQLRISASPTYIINGRHRVHGNPRRAVLIGEICARNPGLPGCAH